MPAHWRRLMGVGVVAPSSELAGDHLCRDAVALSLRSLVGEPELFIHRPGGVVEKRRRRLLARGEIVRVGLNESTAGDADQLQGAADGGRRNSLAAVPPVVEKTGEAEVGAPYEALLPLLAVWMLGSSSTVPNWHQATATSPSNTSAAWARPCSTSRCLYAWLPSCVRSESSTPRCVP